MALKNQCMKPPPHLFLNKLLKPNTENVWGAPPTSLGNLLILPKKVQTMPVSEGWWKCMKKSLPPSLFIHFKGWEIIRIYIYISIGSMYGIYGNMHPINIPQSCWHIYQHHGSYGICIYIYIYCKWDIFLYIPQPLKWLRPQVARNCHRRSAGHPWTIPEVGIPSLPLKRIRKKRKTR